MSDAPLSRPPLSRLLREATATAHARIEGAAFAQRLGAGALDRAALARYYVALLPVYSALEAALAEAEPSSPLAGLRFPELDRVDRLRADIAALRGEPLRSAEQWAEEAPLMAHMYAGRIVAVRHKAPLLVAAHAYVRYLGDLSGGQMLRKAIAAGTGLTEGEVGLSFFDFPELAARYGGLGAFKTRYRAALDELPVDPAATADLVQEAVRAFELNGALFEALGGT